MSMPTAGTIYVGALLLSATGSVALLLHAWRSVPIRALTAMAAIATTMSVSALWMTTVDSEATALLFYRLRLAALALASPTVLVLSLEVTDRGAWTRTRGVALLYVIPALTILAIWVPGEMMYRSIGFDDFSGVRVFGERIRGPWFWIHAGYSWACYFAVLPVLLTWSQRVLARYRPQTLALTAVVTLPLVASLVSMVSRPLGLPNLDYTSLSFLFVWPAWHLLSRRYSSTDLLTTARDALLDVMDEPVLVLGPSGDTIESNEAFRRLQAQAGESIVERIRRSLSTSDPESSWDLHLSTTSGTRMLELRTSPLLSWVEGPATLVRATDVTESTRLMQELDAYDRSVSHDLRSPIGEAIAFLDLHAVQADPDTEKARSFQSAAAQCARRARKIVDAHLQLARARRGEDVARSELDMARIVESVVQRLQGPISDAGARVDVAGHWPRARGDEILVEQVWQNYLTNALRYGGRPPKIQLGADPGNSGDARFWVRDHGPGIEGATPEDLFYPGRRPRSAKGHGLGLTIVRRITEVLGGRVGFEPAAGGGTRFWFTLPGQAGEGEVGRR